MPKLTPEDSVTHYRYDALGNLVKKYVRRGKRHRPDDETALAGKLADQTDSYIFCPPPNRRATPR